MTEEQIKHLVNRFLGWRLPENFNPDAGISFKAAFNEGTAFPMRHEPSGTNLFDATQADAMVRYLIEGMPGLEGETIQTLLDLLNPLHGDLDQQTYDAKVAMDFDMPSDYAHDVTVTAQQERDLTLAVLILENRKRTVPPAKRAKP